MLPTFSILLAFGAKNVSSLELVALARANVVNFQYLTVLKLVAPSLATGHLVLQRPAQAKVMNVRLQSSHYGLLFDPTDSFTALNDKHTQTQGIPLGARVPPQNNDPQQSGNAY